MIKPGVAGWVSDHSADWDTPPMLTVTVARDANCAVKKSLSCMTSAGANSTCNCSAVLPEVPPELQAVAGLGRYQNTMASSWKVATPLLYKSIEYGRNLRQPS